MVQFIKGEQQDETEYLFHVCWLYIFIIFPSVDSYIYIIFRFLRNIILYFCDTQYPQ